MYKFYICSHNIIIIMGTALGAIVDWDDNLKKKKFDSTHAEKQNKYVKGINKEYN